MTQFMQIPASRLEANDLITIAGREARVIKVYTSTYTNITELTYIHNVEQGIQKAEADPMTIYPVNYPK